MAAKKTKSNFLPLVCLNFFGWLLLNAVKFSLITLAPTLQQNFHLTNSRWGQIFSLYMVAYTLGQLVVGYLATRWDSRYILSVGCFGTAGLLGSLLVFGHSLAGFTALVVGVGVTQATFYSPSTALLLRATPVRWVTLSTAMSGIGQNVGQIVAAWLVVSYCPDRHWSLIMSYFAVPLVLLGISYLVVAQRRYLPIAKQATEQPDQALSYWERWSLGGLCMMLFLTIYAQTTLLAWLPLLCRHLSLVRSDTAPLLSMVPTVSCVSALVVGWLAGIWRRYWQLLRLLLVIACGSLLVISFATSAQQLTIGLISYALVGRTVTSPILTTLVKRIIAKRPSAAVFGWYGFVGMCAASLSPIVTGYLTDLTGNFKVAFWVAAVSLLIASTYAHYASKSLRWNKD